MAMLVPQAKRIKLEHSYAYLADATHFEPVTIKEEDPLKFTEDCDVVETIKIEVSDHDDNPVKTEPTEESVDEGRSFEYLSVSVPIPNENEVNEHEILPDQYTAVDSLVKEESVIPKIESVSTLANHIDDPLQLVNFEYVVPEPEVVQTKSEKRNTKRNAASKGTAVDSQSISYLRLQKERDNLQKQIKKVRVDLKDVKAREKALQTELGARRMSELSLEQKNVELNTQLQDFVKKEKADAKLIKELHLRLAHVEKENSLRSDISERVRKEYTDKLDRTKLQLRKKELEHKHLDLKCANLTHTLARLTAKFDIQKIELEQVKQKLQTAEQTHNNTLKLSQGAKQRITDLSKEVALTRRANEELQKSLLTEKKMSRFFIKERDQLLEEQDAKFKEADKELVKLKQSVGSLTAALTQKIAECKAQKEATKVVMVTYQKKSLELRAKMEDVEKKEQELSKKACEYCGF